jgi:cation:H+ antiporter
MSTLLAIPLFLVSLAVTLAAARLFALRLDRLGKRFRFPEALIGLLTAIAADGPEVSSALTALFKNAHDVSIGVLVGSNTFNIAAMLGLSGLLAGSVRLTRDTLLLEGAVGAAITLIAAALLLGFIGPAVAAPVAVAVLVPYVVVLIAGERFLKSRSHPPAHLAAALSEHPGPDRPGGRQPDPTHHLLGLIVLDVALIIAGSVGMVQAALTLGHRWHISSAVLGMLVLGPLTSIPNALTGVRLGLARRGAALVGETFNSNTINLAVGVILPSMFVTLAAASALAKVQLAWLIAMTIVSLIFLWRRGGLQRSEGAVLIIIYAGFVAATLVGSST